MTLDLIPSGTRVFVDSTIFIYHFTGASEACRDLLARCERADVKGLTSVVVLAEVTHRLMMIEALKDGHVKEGGIARKLRERPDIVVRLNLYHRQIERIPLMGIEVLPLDARGFFQSGDLRARYGLLTNDSIVASAAISAGAEAIASADGDLGRLREIRLFRPVDLLSTRAGPPS